MDLTKLQERNVIAPLKLNSVAGYTIYDHNTNEGISKSNIHNLNYIIVDYICKQTQHLLRMNDTQISKLEHEYTPTSRRNISQQNTGWRNQHPWRSKKPGKAYTLSLKMTFRCGRMDSPVNWTRDFQSS
jgi:hypothetical protein